MSLAELAAALEAVTVPRRRGTRSRPGAGVIASGSRLVERRGVTRARPGGKTVDDQHGAGCEIDLLDRVASIELPE